MARDEITVLRGLPKVDGWRGRYRKNVDARNGGVSVSTPPMPRSHSVQSIPVDNLDDLINALEWHRDKPSRCVIRGALTDREEPEKAIVRRSLEEFNDPAHHWVMLDLDSVGLPEGMDWKKDPGGAVRWAIKNTLPDELHDAACYWQLSGSMGYKPGLRVHLWFWMTEPKTSSEMKAWAWSWGMTKEGTRWVSDIGVDTAVFMPVQPHITADPAILGKREVPAGKRAGRIPGGEVALTMGPFEDEIPERVLQPYEAYESEGDGPKHARKADRDSPIGFLNAMVPVDVALEMAGYTHCGRNRYMYPGSSSGTPGVVVINGHCYSHHEGEPLADEHWHDSADVLKLCLEPDASEEDQTVAAFDLAKEIGLQAINEDYFVCHIGSSVANVREYRRRPEDPIELRMMDDKDMTKFFAPQPWYLVKRDRDDDIDFDRKNPAVVWNNWAERRTFDGMVFDPSPTFDDPSVYNEWAGWAVKPEPGGSFELFKELILYGICKGNAEHAQWLWDWMADGIQNPTARRGVTIVIIGGKGVGKTKLGEVYGRLFGEAAVTIDDMDDLVGTFTPLLYNRLFVHLDEALWGGLKKHEGRVKSLITSRTYTVKRKYIDPIKRANYMRFLITSNEAHAAPVADAERRFFVLEAGNKYQQDHDFFAALDRELEDGGYETLMRHLMNREIETDQNKAPWTEAQQAMAEEGIEPHKAWLAEALETGEFLRDYNSSDFGDPEHRAAWHVNGSPWPFRVNPKVAHQAYRDWAERAYRGRRRPDLLRERQFTRWLGGLVAQALGIPSMKEGGRTKSPGSPNEKRLDVWKWPSVQTLRAAFEREHGRRNWDEVHPDVHDLPPGDWSWLG